MSDATHQAVHAAIVAHIADISKGDAMVSDWMLTAAAITTKHDMTTYSFITNPDLRTPHHIMGLAEVMRYKLDEFTDRVLSDPQ